MVLCLAGHAHPDGAFAAGYVVQEGLRLCRNFLFGPLGSLSAFVAGCVVTAS